MRKKLINITHYLFDCDYFSETFDPDGQEEHLDCATNLLNEYSWDEVFLAWNEYLRTCKTPLSVLNFANLFFYYGGCDLPIDMPYDFLGYIYSVVGDNNCYDDQDVILDSLSISILEKAGEISLYDDPYYLPLEDQKLIDAIRKYKIK